MVKVKVMVVEWDGRMEWWWWNGMVMAVEW